MKSRVLSLLVLLSSLIFSSVSYPFDKKLGPLDFINPDINRSFPLVVAEGTAFVLEEVAENKYDKRLVRWVQYGSGYVVLEGYVLTAAHVVVPYVANIPNEKSKPVFSRVISMERRFIKLRTGKYVTVPSQVLYINESDDIAVLGYVPYGLLKPLRFLGKTVGIALDPSVLESGDMVIAILHKRDNNGSILDSVWIAEGKVLDPNPYIPWIEIALDILRTNDMTLMLPVKPGDSGSPVFAFHNGTPYLIGRIRAFAVDVIMMYTYAGWVGSYAPFFQVL